jgi:hypothetical protein
MKTHSDDVRKFSEGYLRLVVNCWGHWLYRHKVLQGCQSLVLKGLPWGVGKG